MPTPRSPGTRRSSCSVMDLQSQERRRPAEVHTTATRNQSPPVSHKGSGTTMSREKRGEGVRHRHI
jgi:hypothetical protein